MEYFYSGGGNNRPYFSYRVKVRKCTEEMYVWCAEYDDEGSYFCRFHVEWKDVYGTTEHPRDYEIVQFERETPALMFTLKFGCI